MFIFIMFKCVISSTLLRCYNITRHQQHDTNIRNNGENKGCNDL